ncbi:unnamed protein product [Meloidogyne enterolobii]|uniref:Uncharacterized protein n=1 Tax=Meloidogyne enterolobii TaxID=390850 RepID=A0ACB1AVE4_MELEN
MRGNKDVKVKKEYVQISLLSGRGIEEVISTALTYPAPIQTTQKPLNAQIDVEKLNQIVSFCIFDYLIKPG